MKRVPDERDRRDRDFLTGMAIGALVAVVTMFAIAYWGSPI